MQKFCMSILAMLIVWTASAQQEVIISGKVLDENNQALIGANVYINGTTYGTATNKNGEFILKNIALNQYQLCVSYSGYKRLRMAIDATTDKTDLVLRLEQSKGNLGEVVVTGTGTPHHLKTAPVPTELLTKKMIENTAAPDFGTLMGAVSPSFDFSPNTMGSNMMLNGLGNDFIVILLDGKRMYGDVGGMNDLSRINPAMIERIEVVKGASSSLYGSDAIAGVINIITKKSNRKFEVGNQTQYGSFNTLQQNNNIDFTAGKLSGRTLFSLKQSDGWQNSAYEIDGDDLVETKAMTQNAYINKNISQLLEYKLTKSLSLYGNVAHYNNDISVPVEVKNYGYFFEDFNYSLGANYIFSPTSTLSFDYTSDRFTYYYKYNQDYKDYTTGELSLNNDQQRKDYNLKWVKKFNDKHVLSLGSEYVEEIYRSEGRVVNGKATANTFSLYAQDEMTIFSHLMLTAGLRVVKHNQFGMVVTPKLSALYKLNAFNLRATYSRGFKAPTMKELYYRYEKRGSLYLGNTNLDPQTSNYYSAGVDFNKNWLSTSISAYQNDVDGLIAYEEIETSAADAANGIKRTKQHYNVEQARTKGVDFMFDIRLPHNFTLGGGYSYVDARNETTGERLSYVAHNYANVRAGYFHDWNNYQLNVQVLGRIQDEKYNAYNNSAKGYNLWKLTTVHKFASFGSFNLSATAGIDNVFDYVDDAPFGTYYGTITPGRTFFAGLNIYFTL
ncbi:TonB-dependent receptor [Carboxylicivirga sp. N1Y90]|uniref:TonB-dependent receptor n=1 Tax=Carboxylicivirga fragile TaxID=3417571 RepID=UPI003D325765|nr:TonB-dependent receptor [Marinilabiliaceae bacterium N1Y90]